MLKDEIDENNKILISLLNQFTEIFIRNIEYFIKFFLDKESGWSVDEIRVKIDMEFEDFKCIVSKLLYLAKEDLNKCFDRLEIDRFRKRLTTND